MMWRLAIPSDDDAIVAMCIELNAEDPGPRSVSALQIGNTLEVFRREPWRGRALVLDVGKASGGPIVVGYALIVPFWSNEQGGEVSTIDEFFVRPSHRGQGHGTALLRELSGSAGLRSPRAVALGLEVSPSNAGANTLYSRLGFSGSNTAMHLRLEPLPGISPSAIEPAIYRELAEWYPLLTPPEDYAKDTATYRRVLATEGYQGSMTLLDLGSGAGHNAFHLKRHFKITLVDLSPEMLALSQGINPECEHFRGDMRELRLGRVFDAVLVHDAIVYMTTRHDLRQAIDTAFAHCAPGGIALFIPDFTQETFRPGEGTGGVDRNGRGLRYLEWRTRPAPDSNTYLTDFAYLMRHPDGTVTGAHDRHVMGLFSRAIWLSLIEETGFRVKTVLQETATGASDGLEIFVGIRPR